MGHSTLADAICDLGITGGTPIVAVPLNAGVLRAPPIEVLQTYNLNCQYQAQRSLFKKKRTG
jgi:hypothetical protein